MKILEKMRGITLVALVVTIIILLILAGVSLQLIGGSSGILSRASHAVDQTEIEGAIEQVEMYLTEIGFDYQEGKYVNRDVEISKLEFLQDKIGEKAELNDCQLTLDAEGNLKVTRKDGKTLLAMGSINADGQVSWESQENNEKEEKTIGYLVDIAEIGDYVDIEIEYENVQDFYRDSRIETESPLSGWRVLSKEGNGEMGTVKLVSAGCPLNYYHNSSPNISINKLEDLYKIIEIGNGSNQFRANGLKKDGVVNNNLQEVFSSGKYIDTSKGVHALGCSSSFTNETGIMATTYSPLNEIEELYTTITGETKSVTELYNIADFVFATKLLKNNVNWKESYTDLLANGQSYILGGTSCDLNCVWYVDAWGRCWGPRFC